MNFFFILLVYLIIVLLNQLATVSCQMVFHYNTNNVLNLELFPREPVKKMGMLKTYFRDGTDMLQF